MNPIVKVRYNEHAYNRCATSRIRRESAFALSRPLSSSSVGARELALIIKICRAY